MYNEEDEKYHTYLTKISSDILSAKEIAKLYTDRWHIELIFKELKSNYGIYILSTAKPEIVKVLIWVDLLTLLVPRKGY